ncbi:MAG: hypothetical protein FWE53_00025 [Firmicutes bacterium]|nr:hypothetical protein [Bacillota bacterium]
MALIDAKCKNCGAALQVDNEKEGYACGHCGAKFVNEKVINQTINQQIIAGEDADSLFMRAVTFTELGEYKDAEKLFKKQIHIAPHDYRGWYGLAVAVTQNWQLYSDEAINNYMKKAEKLSTPEEQQHFKAEYEAYLKHWAKEFNKEIKSIKRASLGRKAKFVLLVVMALAILGGSVYGLLVCWSEYNSGWLLFVSVGASLFALFINISIWQLIMRATRRK